ncbi:C4-dicarboxylate transport [Gossypium arboreum]|uniref:C4-dicarboxylate transport n=1 Tax=Gossypium arboreum TaxID=29729 RepID=A0A0B0N0S7_GOSAR|nr:C4-dicarboxylate transport [Gossypium arboreum]
MFSLSYHILIPLSYSKNLDGLSIYCRVLRVIISCMHSSEPHILRRDY